MYKYIKLIKNTLLFAIGSIGSKVAVFLLMPLYTHAMSSDRLGVADAVYAASTILLYMSSFCIFEATMRFTKMKEQKSEKILTNSILLFFLCIPIAYIFARIISNINIFKEYYIYVFLIVILQNLYNILSQYARGTEQLKLYTFTGLIQALLVLIFSFILLYVLELDVEGYLLAYIWGFLFSSGILFISNIVKYRLDITYVELDLMIAMVKFSLPLVVTGLSWWILNASDKYVILYFINPSANGIYSVAQKIPMMIVAINTIFNSAWQLAAIDESQNSGSTDFYNNVFVSYCLVIFLVGSLLILFGPIILRLLVTARYYEACSYLPFLVIASILHVFGNFLGGLNVAYGKTGNLMISSVVAAAINFGLNLVYTPLWGMYGTALATIIGCLVLFIIRLFDVIKNLHTSIEIKSTTISLFFIICQAAISTFLTEHILNYVLQLLFILVLVFINRTPISVVSNAIRKWRKRNEFSRKG